VSEGKLEIVGANDVMLDVNIPSGESWIRQALYGKTYYREKLGVDVTVGWALDTFGHHAQMPQLLKLAGYKSYWFQRGVHGNDTPSEFLWEGIDGTRIPAFWLPLGYGMFYPRPPACLISIVTRANNGTRWGIIPAGRSVWQWPEPTSSSPRGPANHGGRIPIVKGNSHLPCVSEFPPISSPWWRSGPRAPS